MEDVRIKVGSNSLILDILCSFADLESLKTFRLVNKTWLSCTAKYVKLVLKPDKENRDGEIQELLADPQASLQRNVKIMLKMVPDVLSRFQTSLVCLQLEHVVFQDVQELKQVLFWTFPNLKDLNIAVSVVSNRSSLAGDCKLHDSVSQSGGNSEQVTAVTGLKRLQVKRVLREDAFDPFVNWGCQEIINQFRSIKKLSFEECPGLEPLPIFEALNSASVELEGLLYKNFAMEPNTPGISEYLRRSGSKLKYLSLSMSQSQIVEIFREFPREQLRILVLRLDIEKFGKGTYANLTHLYISHFRPPAAGFLSNCPKLTTVLYEDVLKTTGSGLLHVQNPIPCTTVTTLTVLTDTIWSTTRANVFFSTFPNVRKFHVVAFGGQCMSSLFPYMCASWKKLVSIIISCRSGFALDDGVTDSEIGNGRGNVHSDMLKEMAYNMRELESVNFDTESMCFGDDDAWIFLSMKKLRYLRIGRGSFSTHAMAALREKLFCLKIKKIV